MFVREEVRLACRWRRAPFRPDSFVVLHAPCSSGAAVWRRAPSWSRPVFVFYSPCSIGAAVWRAGAVSWHLQVPCREIAQTIVNYVYCICGLGVGCTSFDLFRVRGRGRGSLWCGMHIIRFGCICLFVVNYLYSRDMRCGWGVRGMDAARGPGTRPHAVRSAACTKHDR